MRSLIVWTSATVIVVDLVDLPDIAAARPSDPMSLATCHCAVGVGDTRLNTAVDVERIV